MKKDNLINVLGCPRCKKLVGDLEESKQTRIVDGYTQCSICGADIDYFWLNLTKMKFQKSRPVPIEEVNKTAKLFSMA